MEEGVNDGGESSQNSDPIVDLMAKEQTRLPVRNERDCGILHHHYFGRYGLPVSTRATSTDWDHLPFVKPVKVEWKIQVSELNLLRLSHGYEPQQMEDKWFIYADGPNRAGDLVINFIRSWTGLRVAELLVRTTNNNEGLWTGEIVELTFEGDDEEAEEVAEAAMENTLLIRSTDTNVSSGYVPVNDTHATADAGLKQDTGDNDIDELGTINTTTSQNILSVTSQMDKTSEDHAKFLVTMACKWVMHVDLGVDIPEPKW